ncbi:PepSY-associated TM helix [Pelotomaculum sp. FP]|nr:PepSY-associated TM helix [Pelotomaculum sp. FP]
MKKCRQLHLWIGLLTSLLILIEAVTGLIMVEPWLIGSNMPSTEQWAQVDRTGAGGAAHGREAPEYKGAAEGEAAQGGGAKNYSGQNNIMGFIKALHSGKVNNANLSILLDIAAIGLIFLTTTGIILTVRTLKAQGAAKKRY